jgi:hypothetical protein
MATSFIFFIIKSYYKIWQTASNSMAAMTAKEPFYTLMPRGKPGLSDCFTLCKGFIIVWPPSADFVWIQWIETTTLEIKKGTLGFFSC